MSGETATDSQRDSSPDGVAEDWENDEATERCMEKQLGERVKQVRILQRAQADKEARKERAKYQEESRAATSQSDAATSSAAVSGPVKMQILRRPKSDDQLKEEDQKAVIEAAEERIRKTKTLEERQAAYDEARNRILGTDYKPDPANTGSVAVVNRSKSPEQIRVPRYQQSTGPMGPGMITSMGPPSSVMTTPYGMSTVVVQQPSIPYAVPITTGQPFVSYIDTTRPPPVMSAAAMVPMVMGPPCPNNQYYSSTSISQQIGSISSVSGGVQYGHPPIAIYPPGTLGAAMRASFEAGQTQSQKKNRNRSKNNQAKKETNA